MLRRFLHLLAHLAGTNHGRVLLYNRRGVFMSGFLCECGKIQDLKPVSAAEALRIARGGGSLGAGPGA